MGAVQEGFDLYGQRENLAAVDGFGPFPGPGECTNAGSFFAGASIPFSKSGSTCRFPTPSITASNRMPI